MPRGHRKAKHKNKRTVKPKPVTSATDSTGIQDKQFVAECVRNFLRCEPCLEVPTILFKVLRMRFVSLRDFKQARDGSFCDKDWSTRLEWFFLPDEEPADSQAGTTFFLGVAIPDYEPAEPILVSDAQDSGMLLDFSDLDEFAARPTIWLASCFVTEEILQVLLGNRVPSLEEFSDPHPVAEPSSAEPQQHDILQGCFEQEVLEPPDATESNPIFNCTVCGKAAEMPIRECRATSAQEVFCGIRCHLLSCVKRLERYAHTETTATTTTTTTTTTTLSLCRRSLLAAEVQGKILTPEERQLFSAMQTILSEYRAIQKLSKMLHSSGQMKAFLLVVVPFLSPLVRGSDDVGILIFRSAVKMIELLEHVDQLTKKKFCASLIKCRFSSAAEHNEFVGYPVMRFDPEQLQLPELASSKNSMQDSNKSIGLIMAVPRRLCTCKGTANPSSEYEHQQKLELLLPYYRTHCEDLNVFYRTIVHMEFVYE
jgi:hypothetical protein